MMDRKHLDDEHKKMDSRFLALYGEHPCDNLNGDVGVMQGFQFAIKRLRENAHYGHYAQQLADWLEKHLTQEVTSDKASAK